MRELGVHLGNPIDDWIMDKITRRFFTGISRIAAFCKRPTSRVLDAVNGFGGAALALLNSQRSFRYELVVGAIFRDEAEYLDEWLRFHRSVGVDHFYLYDNGSNDRPVEALQEWIESGHVTLIDWPGDAAQRSAYNDCIRRFRSEARWVAFIDIDEFLYSPRGRDLKIQLSDYSDVAAVFVYWVLFGSSGHVSKPSGSIIENYTYCLDLETANDSPPLKAKLVTGRVRQGKCIVNPRLVRKYGVHLPESTWTGLTLDENRQPPASKTPESRMTADVFRINHYWSKSIEELVRKVRRGSGAKGKSAVRIEKDFLAWEQELNVAQDLTLQKIWRGPWTGRR